jgi:hypothetical protein
MFCAARQRLGRAFVLAFVVLRRLSRRDIASPVLPVPLAFVMVRYHMFILERINAIRRLWILTPIFVRYIIHFEYIFECILFGNKPIKAI